MSPRTDRILKMTHHEGPDTTEPGLIKDGVTAPFQDPDSFLVVFLSLFQMQQWSRNASPGHGVSLLLMDKLVLLFTLEMDCRHAHCPVTCSQPFIMLSKPLWAPALLTGGCWSLLSWHFHIHSLVPRLSSFKGILFRIYKRYSSAVGECLPSMCRALGFILSTI